MTIVVLPETSRDLVSERLRRLTRMLRAAGVETAEGCLGGSDGYGAAFSNSVFTMRPFYWGDCTCGASDSETETACAPDCPQELPNFKCGDFEVRWYKWIGRSMETRPVDPAEGLVNAVFDWCEASLERVAVEGHPI